MNQTRNLCQTDFTGSIAELFSQSSSLSNSSLIIQNSTFANSYGFTGRYLDEETSLWYFRARYFDNELGRFISRDPLGFVDGHGLYNGDFSERFGLDPSGKEKKCCEKEWGGWRFPFNWFHTCVARDCDAELLACRIRGTFVCVALKTRLTQMRTPSAVIDTAVTACAASYLVACNEQNKWCKEWNKKHGF